MLVIKNPPANAGDIRDKCSILGSGRFPGEGNATHSSILAWRIPRTEEAWQATVCGVIKSQIQLKWLSKIQKQPKYLPTHTHTYTYIHNGILFHHKKGWNAVFCNSLEGTPEYYAWWSKANDSIFFCYLIKCNSMPCPCLSFSIGFKISSFSLNDFCLVSNFQFLVCIFLISVNYFHFDACYLRDSPPTPYPQPRYKSLWKVSPSPTHSQDKIFCLGKQP